MVPIGSRTASTRVATIMPALRWLNLRLRAKIGSPIDSPAVRCGTSRAPAHPFLRPSYDARANDALQAANAKWNAGMKQVIAGLK